MMSYRDRTWCGFYEDCAKGAHCSRACTPDVETKARQRELRISMFVDRPGCFLDKEETE